MRWNNDGYVYVGNSLQQIVKIANYSDVNNLSNTTLKIYKESKSYTINVGRWGEGIRYNNYTKIDVPSQNATMGLYVDVNISIPTYTIHLTNTSYSYTVSGFGLFSSQNGESLQSDTKKYYSVVSWNSPKQEDYTGSLNTNIILSTDKGQRDVLNLSYNIGNSNLASRLSSTNLDDLYIGATFECFYSNQTYIDIPSYTLTYTYYYMYV